MQYRISDLVDLPGFQQVMQSWYSVAGLQQAQPGQTVTLTLLRGMQQMQGAHGYPDAGDCLACGRCRGMRQQVRR